MLGRPAQGLARRSAARSVCGRAVPPKQSLACFGTARCAGCSIGICPASPGQASQTKQPYGQPSLRLPRGPSDGSHWQLRACRTCRACHCVDPASGSWASALRAPQRAGIAGDWRTGAAGPAPARPLLRLRAALGCQEEPKGDCWEPHAVSRPYNAVAGPRRRSVGLRRYDTGYATATAGRLQKCSPTVWHPRHTQGRSSVGHLPACRALPRRRTPRRGVPRAGQPTGQTSLNAPALARGVASLPKGLFSLQD